MHWSRWKVLLYPLIIASWLSFSGTQECRPCCPSKSSDARTQPLGGSCTRSDTRHTYTLLLGGCWQCAVGSSEKSGRVCWLLWSSIKTFFCAHVFRFCRTLFWILSLYRMSYFNTFCLLIGDTCQPSVIFSTFIFYGDSLYRTPFYTLPVFTFI